MTIPQITQRIIKYKAQLKIALQKQYITKRGSLDINLSKDIKEITDTTQRHYTEQLAPSSINGVPAGMVGGKVWLRGGAKIGNTYLNATYYRVYGVLTGKFVLRAYKTYNLDFGVLTFEGVKDSNGNLVQFYRTGIFPPIPKSHKKIYALITNQMQALKIIAQYNYDFDSILLQRSDTDEQYFAHDRTTWVKQVFTNEIYLLKLQIAYYQRLKAIKVQQNAKKIIQPLDIERYAKMAGSESFNIRFAGQEFFSPHNELWQGGKIDYEHFYRVRNKGKDFGILGQKVKAGDKNFHKNLINTYNQTQG